MEKFIIELDGTEVNSFIESLNQLSWDLDEELTTIESQLRREMIEEQKKIVNDAMIQLMGQIFTNNTIAHQNKTKMSKEQFDKLEREWIDSGDWKVTSLDLEFKVWLEMKGYKLSQEEFDKFNTKER